MRIMTIGLYVLCYDHKMTLVKEVGPFRSERIAREQEGKARQSGKYRHVEVAEQVKLK